MEKYTRGEWSFRKTKNGNYKISSPSRADFCKVLVASGRSDMSIREYIELEEEAEANAMVISCATELLEHLEYIVLLADQGALWEGINNTIVYMAIKEARELIKNASK